MSTPSWPSPSAPSVWKSRRGVQPLITYSSVPAGASKIFSRWSQNHTCSNFITFSLLPSRNELKLNGLIARTWNWRTPWLLRPSRRSVRSVRLERIVPSGGTGDPTTFRWRPSHSSTGPAPIAKNHLHPAMRQYQGITHQAIQYSDRQKSSGKRKPFQFLSAFLVMSSWHERCCVNCPSSTSGISSDGFSDLVRS